METMNPLNGVRQQTPYAMAPEYTNNNYLTGSPGTFSGDLQRLQSPEGLTQHQGCVNECDESVFNTVDINSIHGSGYVNSVGAGSHFMNPHVSNNLTVGGGNFTFTSPTQLSFNSPAITSTPFNRFTQARTMPQAFAPTSCLQWQHTVPQRIPWSACNQAACERDILKFTGGNSSMSNVTFTNQTLPVCSVPQRISPVPSCSHPPRRLKRQAPDTLSKPPFTSKIHLTEDMISKHMQGLQIENAASLPPKVGSLRSQTGASQSQTTQHWQKFQDLEDRLALSDEEDDTSTCSTGDLSTPRLHIVDDIAKMVNSEPVIPQDILDKISNPHMELVLWTPPGGAIKEFIESTTQSSQIAEADNMTNKLKEDGRRTDQVQSFDILPNSVLESMEEDRSMDIESADDDNLML